MADLKKAHGKKYLAKAQMVDKAKVYTVGEAIGLLIQTSPTKFDATCELHINLTIDPKRSDQMIRSTVALPHGTGNQVRIVAFVDDSLVKEALGAGAIKAGLDDLMDEVSKGFTDFDVAIATPDTMKQIAKLAKILGPKGLMPNIKSGTVSTEVSKTIGELKKGRIEFKSDKQAIIHTMFGKISFGAEKLTENLQSLMRAIHEAKPSGVKGNLMKSAYITSAMGPSMQISLK